MKNTTIIFTILSLSLFLSGCGTDEYERRLSDTAKGSNASSASSVLSPETTVPGTTISLKLPPGMQLVSNIDDPVHGKCPLLPNVQGWKATYEGYVAEDKTGNKQSFYLYVLVSPPQPTNITATQAAFSDLQNGKFPAGADSSAAVNKSYGISTPEGSSKQFEEMHYSKCPQSFSYPTSSNPQNTKDIDGNFVSLSCTENGQVVTLIYRYPTHWKDYRSASFDPDWIKLVAGTLKIGASGG